MAPSEIVPSLTRLLAVSRSFAAFDRRFAIKFAEAPLIACAHFETACRGKHTLGWILARGDEYQCSPHPWIVGAEKVLDLSQIVDRLFLEFFEHFV